MRFSPIFCCKQNTEGTAWVWAIYIIKEDIMCLYKTEMEQDNYFKTYKLDGHYNHLPTDNFVLLNNDEFMDSEFFGNQILFHETRQVCVFLPGQQLKLGLSKDNAIGIYSFLDLKIFWYAGGTGIAFSKYNRQLRFYKFKACEHEYSTKDIDTCLVRYRCINCGYEFTIDSSD